MGQKLSKAQRLAFAKVLYHAFHVLANISVVIKTWTDLREAMTAEECEELDKINKMAYKLGERYRKLAWKLEGYDYEVGPPRRAKK